VILLDLSPVERLHLGIALRDRRKVLRRDGQDLPPRLRQLGDALRPEAVMGGLDSADHAAAANAGDLGGPRVPAFFVCPGRAASLLGISVRTLRRLAAAGTVPSVAAGRGRKYRLADLERYAAALPPGKQVR
jgi:excisionase family DNA binding protein